MAKAGLQFARKDTWSTPQWVIDRFGPFDYDPCTTKEIAERMGMPHYDTIETDGLAADWTKYNRVFVNPPFSRKYDWLQKAVDTYREAKNKILFLMPIETLTTHSFHRIIGDTKYTLWIPSGRICFEDGGEKTSTPAFGTVLLEFSEEFNIIQFKGPNYDQSQDN